jgi:hypothetical protein
MMFGLVIPTLRELKLKIESTLRPEPITTQVASEPQFENVVSPEPITTEVMTEPQLESAISQEPFTSEVMSVPQQYTVPVRAIRKARRRILVNRIPRPYWEEAGWHKQDGNYDGFYRTRFGTWPGAIAVSPSNRVEVYIHNPPPILRRHPHWQCFFPRKNGWRFIHSPSEIEDVSAAILSVERTITEAYEM